MKKVDRTIFLFVGKTNTGKDTIANELVNRFGYKLLRSYTTRPKRINETNEHIFISDDEIKNYTEKMVAYTKIGEYKYFATIDQLEESDIYIIDPNGVLDLKLTMGLNFPDKNFKFITIFINTPNDYIRKQRSEKRGDDNKVYLKRCQDEEEQFQDFLINCDFDYAVLNDDLDTTVNILKEIMWWENEDG